jgi:LCP family protein required for cell wall assembly
MRISPLAFRTLALTLVAAIAVVFWLGLSAFRTAEKISVGGDKTRESLSDFFPGGKRAPLRGEEGGRINFLLLGRAGQSYPGQNLTDTVMVASLDLENRKSAFLSLPRDLFVPIPGTELSTKLNSLYQYGLTRDEGIEPLREAVEEITGLDIPYFVIVDFDGFEKIIDEVGGVTVFSERDIYDARYPGKNYSYETFELPAGWHTLDGATALRFARERHSDPEGDFGRAKRQQQIIKAFQEKIFSTRTLLDAPSIQRMLDILGESVRTDLTLPEMLSLAELVRTIDLRNASTAVVDAWKRESLLRVSHIDVGGVAAFILVPRTGNWTEVRDLAEHIFEQETIRRRREAIETESARILVVARPEDAGVAARLGRALEDTIPAESIASITETDLAKRSRGTVFEAGVPRKLVTLDEVLRLFPLNQVTSLPADITPDEVNDVDIVITVGDDMHRILLEMDAIPASERTDASGSDAFSEYFPAQSH